MLLVRVALAWWVVLQLGQAAHAQAAYRVSLADALKVGQVYRVAADADVEDQVTYSQNGVPGYEEQNKHTLALVGELTIQAVTPAGRLSQAALRVDRLEGRVNGSLLDGPGEQDVAGEVVLILKVEDGKLLIQAREDEPDWLMGWQSMLVLLLDVDVTSVSLADVFEPERAVAVGDHWRGEPGKVAERFRQAGLSTPEDGVTDCEAGLLKVVDIDGVPMGQIRMTTVLKDPQPAAVEADASVELISGSMTIIRERVSPVKPAGVGHAAAGLPKQSVMKMDSHAAYRTEGGVEIQRVSKMRRTVQWEAM